MLKELTARIDGCAEEIDHRNRRNFVFFSNGALIIASLALAASIIMPYYRSLLLTHGALFLYSGVLFFFSRWCQQKEIGQIRLIMYTALAPLLTAGVLLGSWLDPMRPAITIMIFLCVLPLYIIDRPLHIILYQLMFAALFIGCAWYAKPHEVFQADVIYLPIYLSFGIGTYIFSLFEKVESAENYVRARQESQHDALTQLLNRRCGEERVKDLFAQHAHGTFAVMDVDSFKQFNDTYGHQAGDAVLCGIADALHHVFRTTDIIWRLGGDEYAIFALNMTDEGTCRTRFEALARELENLEIPSCGTLEVHISVGCTICTGERSDFEKIYHSSDDALYEAKNQGKGKIIVVRDQG